jgi:hypothetical protein
VREIEELWARQEEVRGWARYWEMIYAFVLRALDRNAMLREAAYVVRYEDLCAAPDETLLAIARHCELELGPRTAEARARIRIAAAEPALSAADRATVWEEAGPRAADFGYDPPPGER